MKTQFKKTQSLIAIAVAATFSLAAATANADELSDLKAQLKALANKVSELETRQPVASSAPAKPVAQALKTDQEGKPYEQTGGGISLYSNGDTELKMYGIVEATIGTANNQGSSGKSATGFQTSWFSGNRLGFDANHAVSDLGATLGMPDLKVIAKLETEFELPTGNMDTANVLFNRDAWMGFYSEKLGKLTLGRQNTLTRDFTNNWGDPYGAAETTLKEGGYSNVNNFKQFIFYSGGPNGTRYNSAVEWKKDWDKHWITGFAFKFGSGGAGGSGDVGNGGALPGDFADGTAKAVSVAYNNLGLVGDVHANLNASYNTANINNLNHHDVLIGGNIVFSPAVRYNLGFVNYQAQQGAHNSLGERHDNSWTNSLKFTPAGKFEYDLGYQVMKGTNAGLNAGGVTLNPFGNTAGVTATASGDKKTTYGSIIYHADKQLDVYVAGDVFKVGGGWVVGDAQGNGSHYGAGQSHSGTTELAVGARFKF